MAIVENVPSASARQDSCVSERIHGLGSGLQVSAPKLRLELVDAKHAPEMATACYREKLACYARFGAATASVPLPNRIDDDHLHLVTATDCESGVIVGSVSLYRRSINSPLPIEAALGEFETMKNEIKTWQGQRIYEMSGLWAQDVWRKTGLSEQLLHATIAAANVLKAARIIAFGHQHLVNFYETVGLLPKLELGRFSYPTPEYVSTVLWADPIGFSTIPIEKRSRLVTYAQAFQRKHAVNWCSFDERVDMHASSDTNRHG